MNKLLKTTLILLIVALIATLTVNVYAYSGTTDANDNIKIHDTISNGMGIVEITPDVATGYKLYFQWVEIDKNTYDQITKINDEIEVIKYYNLYEAYTSAGMPDNEFGKKYEDAQNAYKAKYGSLVADFSDKHSAELTALRIHLFPNYNDANWSQTTDNTFKMDLSTFAGTKNYTVWIKLVTATGTVAYDAQAFELTGTKQSSTDNGDNNPGDNNPGDNNPGDNKPGDNKPGDNNPGDNNPGDNNPSDNKPGDNKPGDNNPGDNNPGNNKPGDNKPDDNKPGDNNPGDNNPGDNKPGDNNPDDNKPGDNNPGDNKPSDNKPDDNKPDNNKPNDNKPGNNNKPSKDDTTSNTKLPQTGVSSGIIIAMIIASCFAVVEFVKYKKIK